MLLLTLFLSFTGYLLPWDQLAFWAVTVGTNIASSVPLVGPTIRELLIGGRDDRPADADPLLRAARHRPAGRARRALRLPHVAGPQGRRPGARRPRGALAQPAAEAPPATTKTYTLLGVARGTAPTVRASSLEAPDTTVNSVPDLTRRAAIVVARHHRASSSILAVFIRSPLEEPANPLVTPNPAKAPWYFLWLQEIVTDTTFTLGSLHHQRRVPRRRAPAGLLVALLDRLAVARPQPGRRRRASGSPRERRTQNARLPACSSLVVLVLTLVGTFLRGPYWHFYWPWQAWPEHPGEDLSMEKRTDSPYPRQRPAGPRRRRRRCSSSRRVLFAWSDREHDWRYYQYAVPRRWSPRSSAPTRPQTVPAGLQQIWVPALRRADRCVTCHQATRWKGFETADEPFRTHPPEPLKNHPIEKFGCTACHGGQGWAIDADAGARPGRALGGAAARRRRSARPTRSRTTRTRCMQMNCNVCHRYDRETKGADAINLAKRLVQEKGCRACHVINGRGGTIGPDLTFVGDKAPEQYDYGRLSGQKTAFAWHVAHFKDPRALVAGHGHAELPLHAPSEAQALAMLVLSWRKRPVPADYLAGVAAHRPADARGGRRRAADEDRARAPGS